MATLATMREMLFMVRFSSPTNGDGTQHSRGTRPPGLTSTARTLGPQRRPCRDIITGGLLDDPGTETADLLGLHAAVDLRVRDWYLGTWTGRSLTEIASTSSQDLEHWTTDPDFAVHGGESLTQFRLRVTDWLDQLETEGHPRLVTVAPIAVVRAALVSVLDAPTTTLAPRPRTLDIDPHFAAPGAPRRPLADQ
jgi:hypothetical protein